MHGLMGGGWKRGATTVDAKDPGGETPGVSAKTYRRATPPRQSSTLHRTVVSSEVFTALDNYLWTLTYKWAKHSHPNKPKRWVVDRYFGRFNKTRQDRWVFGDRDSGAYLIKFSWTKIIRHHLVKGRASPDDPDLTDYWAARRRKGPPLPLDKSTLRLLQAQHGRCPVCGGPLLPAESPPASPREWEHWLRTTRKAIGTTIAPVGGPSDAFRRRLTHVTCQRQHVRDNPAPALLTACKPAGLA